MNTLAREQEKWLTGKKSKNEFFKEYYEMREKDLKRPINNLTYETRKRLHPFVVNSYKLINGLNGLSYEILKDESTPTDRPIIYVPTHIGKFDIQVITVAKQYFYTLLSGDYEHIQGKFDGKFLGINGIIYFNEKDKKDRLTVIPRVVKCLLNGESIMWFMEGTWNTTDNLLMLPAYKGVIDAARQANAIIVPIAINQYGKHFKIEIGKNFDVFSEENKHKNSIELTEELRDYLATLKFEIFSTENLSQDEFYTKAIEIFNNYLENNIISNDCQEIMKKILCNDGINNRLIDRIISSLACKLKREYWKDYQNARYNEWPGFSTEYIDGLIFKPKHTKTEITVVNPNNSRLVEINEYGRYSVIKYSDNSYDIERNSRLNEPEVKNIQSIVAFCEDSIKKCNDENRTFSFNGKVYKVVRMSNDVVGFISLTDIANSFTVVTNITTVDGITYVERKINYPNRNILVNVEKSSTITKNIISTNIEGKLITIDNTSTVMPKPKEINDFNKRFDYNQEESLVETYSDEIFNNYISKKHKNKSKTFKLNNKRTR